MTSEMTCRPHNYEKAKQDNDPVPSRAVLAALLPVDKILLCAVHGLSCPAASHVAVCTDPIRRSNCLSECLLDRHCLSDSQQGP